MSYTDKLPACNTWTFVAYAPRDVDENDKHKYQNQFSIQNIYLDNRPRLISAYEDPALWSTCVSSNRKRDNYKKKNCCIWKIEIVSK